MSTNWTRTLCLCLLTAAGCGGHAATPQSPAAEAPSSAPENASSAPSAASAGAAPAAPPKEEAPGESEHAPAPPKVTLLDAGQAPRRKLRYAFKMKPETLALEMDMKMAVRVGEKQSPETALPTIRTLVKIVPRNVSPEGDLVYDGEVVREEVLANGSIPAAIRDKLSASLKTAQGMKVAATVTSRGVVKDATMQIPENASDEVRQALENTRDSLRTLCTPLPEEEVGQGGRWRVDLDVWAGFRMAQATTFTLKSLSANRAKLEAAFEQTAASQPVTGAGVPPGATLRLERLSGKGSGTMEVSFDRVSPVSSVSSDTETAMVVSVEGQTMPTGSLMHFDIRVKPGK